jgi:hypothetical protein
MSQERRREVGSAWKFPALGVRGKQVRGMVHDLSLKGLSCSTTLGFFRGECDLILELDSGVRIRVHGRVIRSGGSPPLISCAWMRPVSLISEFG